ncbi:hypothetical protein KI387_026004, partial [Taxus chinensis]
MRAPTERMEIEASTSVSWIRTVGISKALGRIPLGIPIEGGAKSSVKKAPEPQMKAGQRGAKKASKKMRAIRFYVLNWWGLSLSQKKGLISAIEKEDQLFVKVLLLANDLEKETVEAVVQTIESNMAWFEDEEMKNNALLFRKFAIRPVADFKAVFQAFAWEKPYINLKHLHYCKLQLFVP